MTNLQLPDGSFSAPPPGAIMGPPPGSFSAPPPGAVIEQPSDTQTTAPPLSWGTRLASLFGNPAAQQQVLDASTVAVHNSPAGGVAQGMKDIYYGGRQLATHGIAAIDPNATTQGWANSADAATNAAETDYQQNWRQGQPQTGIDWGRMVGNVLGMAPIASFLPVGSSLIGRAGAGALSGGVSSALMPTDTTNTSGYWGPKAEQVAAGTVTGGVAGPVLGGVAGAVSPTLRPGAQTLIDSGVGLTPGQAVGGAANRIEQALSSVPFIGDAIKEGRGATIEEFNRGAINQALKPIGETLEAGGAGREAIAEMQNKIAKAYDDASSGLGITAQSPASLQLAGDLTNIAKNASMLPPDKAVQFQKILNSQLLSKMSLGGGLAPQDFQDAKSALGQWGSQYIHSSLPDDRHLGGALLQAQTALRSALQTANPDAADALGKADAAYAMSKRVQGASIKVAGGEPGVFSPAALQGSIRAQDPTAGKRAFAAGDALMQPYAEAGQTILGNTVPDSGTALRQMVGHGVGLLGLYPAAEGLANAGIPMHISLPTVGAAYLATKGLYSPTGRNFMTGLLTNRPPGFAPTAGLLRAAVPYTGPALSGLLSQYQNSK